MILDSHQHFWNYEPVKHAWIDDTMNVIRQDFMPEMLKKEFDEYQIEGCIAVQADQNEAENEFLLNLAENNDFIKGIVGWVDLQSDSLEERLKYYDSQKKIKGFRHIVQAEKDPDFLLRKPFLAGISQLSNYNFTYDILVFPHQLGAVLEFVKKFPKQKFVIDHLAKPYIKDGFIEGWANQIKAIGACENVWCKLSGMITEADYKKWTYKDLDPYMNIVLEAFGPERILYGSDWPVCLVAGQYGEVLEVAKRFANSLSAQEQEQFWFKNAIEFYNLKQ
ncbi:amidohydrolase family protein [Flavimarina sp. Hel_I_48]|uniref:amidohydrolase family protein n=1 Tax=Flavimarina sp. Hel_I_48 TaxID=1392488 RepID=UPI0004DF45BD|nr:amidohydrolase family protein [Flavimarina sp. Hel_I_48]